MLVAEYLDRRVTERDFKGNILKQFPANLPVGCQRLRNGETLIVTKQQLLIVDRDGKNVFAHTIQGILAARRLRNGQFAVATSGGRCQLLDKDGRMIKDFYMGGAVYTLGGNIEVLPNGRILAPIRTLNAVIEFDWEGNKHWQASVTSPVSLSRLPSGNTLVTCMDYRIVEIDRDGKEVWTYQTEGRPFCARRR
jgi:outer membrane protein assembly factor BamB